MKRLIFIIILVYFVFQSCNTSRGHYSKDGSTWIWNNQRIENTHRPLKLDSTEKWINKANEIDSLNNFGISVLSKKWCSFNIGEKEYMFDENWLMKKSQTDETKQKIENISQYLSINKEETEQLMREFVGLGLNRFTKEKDYIIFVNETWLSFSKGYLYFPEIYNIKEKDTINLNQLTKGNYRKGWWNNFIIEKKINDNWYEFYRPTGLKDTEQ